MAEDGVVRYAMPANPKHHLPWYDKKGVMHSDLPADKTLYLDGHRRLVYEVPYEGPRDPVYTAMGAFITAYAREKTIRSAQTVYDRLIYCDTDSLHICGWDIPDGLDVHPTRLGAWKNEGRFSYSKFIRAKTYMETVIERRAGLREYCRLMQAGVLVYREKKEVRVPDTLRNYCLLLNQTHELYRVAEEHEVFFQHTKVTCAGMPDNVKEQVTYENFHSGSTFDGKLMPRRYVGGIVLQPTTFTIK